MSGLWVRSKPRRSCKCIKRRKKAVCERINSNYLSWQTCCRFFLMWKTISNWSYPENFLPKISRWFCYYKWSGWKKLQSRSWKVNLFVRKMTVSDNLVGAIEKKTLLRTPAMYRYNEVITKTFLATTVQQSWKHEDIFTKETIRRPIIALCSGDAFIGTNTVNPFNYQ